MLFFTLENYRKLHLSKYYKEISYMALLNRMGKSSLHKLQDSISKLESFCSSEHARTELIQKYCSEISEILAILKPVLDEIDPDISHDEKLNDEIGMLQAVVSEAKELVGSWNSLMSKIYFVSSDKMSVHLLFLVSPKPCITDL